MENGFAEGYAVGQGNSNYNNGFGFGGDWLGLIALAAIFGWGGFGGGYGGFGGGRYGGASELTGYELGKLATTNDVASGFSTSEIMSDLNDIILGQATMQNFINQGFAGLNSTINSGFAGVNNAICTLGYQNQAGFNAISREIASCCCDTRAAIADVKYANERNTCDIIRAGQDNTRAILDYLSSEKISALQAENAGLKAQISNDKQSAYLISQLKEPCPIPAYTVPNPNCCYPTYAVGTCGASVL